MAQPVRAVRGGSLTYRDLWQTPEDGNRYALAYSRLRLAWVS